MQKEGRGMKKGEPFFLLSGLFLGSLFSFSIFAKGKEKNWIIIKGDEGQILELGKSPIGDFFGFRLRTKEGPSMEMSLFQQGSGFYPQIEIKEASHCLKVGYIHSKNANWEGVAEFGIPFILPPDFGLVFTGNESKDPKEPKEKDLYYLSFIGGRSSETKADKEKNSRVAGGKQRIFGGFKKGGFSVTFNEADKIFFIEVNGKRIWSEKK